MHADLVAGTSVGSIFGALYVGGIRDQAMVVLRTPCAALPAIERLLAK